MKLERIFQIVFVFVLSQMMFGASVLGLDRTVGVSPGQWFKYGDITFHWSSNDPNATIPLGYEMWELYNETEWVSISIQQVSGTNITLDTAWHLTIGSEWTYGGYIDVDTGTGENASLMVISAGLSEGDSIYADSWIINETIIRTYPDSTRETNHINMTMEGPYGEYYLYISMNYYWDKETGILTEQSLDMEGQKGEYLSTWSVSMKITESNAWVVPEFPTWALILVFVGLTTALLIYKRRLLKTPIH